MRSMDHVHYLAEKLGPRGSTTSQEKAASEYAAQVLVQAGLEPVTESFVSARSGWYPYVLFSGFILFSELLFLFGGGGGAIAAAIVSVLTSLSVLLELAFRPNPLRWLLPKGQSRNVWARLHPSDQAREQVVLVGHIDTHRTPLAFSSDRWLKLFTSLVPVGLLSTLFLILLFVIGIGDMDLLWRVISLPFALVFLGIFLLTFQADFTPYTAGANDNASGAAVVLSLAERLINEPLIHTKVWVAICGCEEVGCYGADAFAQAHQKELEGAAWITLDSVGGAHTSLAYVTKETFLLPTRSDPRLVKLANEVANRNPELGASTITFSGAYTEGAIGGKYGFRVLSFLSVGPNGELPEWHRRTDVVENLDPNAIERCETFLWNYLREMDRQTALDE